MAAGENKVKNTTRTINNKCRKNISMRRHRAFNHISISDTMNQCASKYKNVREQRASVAATNIGSPAASNDKQNAAAAPLQKPASEILGRRKPIGTSRASMEMSVQIHFAVVGRGIIRHRS